MESEVDVFYRYCVDCPYHLLFVWGGLILLVLFIFLAARYIVSEEFWEYTSYKPIKAYNSYCFINRWSWIAPFPFLIIVLQSFFYIRVGLYPCHLAEGDTVVFCFLSGLFLCVTILPSLKFVFPSPAKRNENPHYFFRFFKYVCIVDVVGCVIAVLIPLIPVLLIHFGYNKLPHENTQIIVCSYFEVAIRTIFVTYHLIKHNYGHTRKLALINEYQKIVDKHQQKFEAETDQLQKKLEDFRDSLARKEAVDKELSTIVNNSTAGEHETTRFNELTSQALQLKSAISELQKEIKTTQKIINRYKRIGFSLKTAN